MSKMIPVLVTFLMIFSGVAGAMIPIGAPKGHLSMETTHVQERTVAPMLWNGSDGMKYDAIAYDISVALDPVTGNLTASVKATVLALKAMSSFNMTFLGSNKVVKIRDGSNNLLQYKHNSSLNRLTVNLTGPATVGQNYDIFIDYGGQVNRSLFEDNCDWTNGGLLQRKTPWYPMPLFAYGFDNIRSRDLDRHNVTVHVLVPGNWSVVSVGSDQGVVTQGPFKNYTFKSQGAIGGTTVAAGNFSVNTTTYKGVTLSTHMFKLNATRSGRFMDKAKSILDWFTPRFGSYPYPNFRMVEVTDTLGGFESDQELVITDTFASNVVSNDMVVGFADQSCFFATTPIGNYDAWLTWSMAEYMATYYQLSVDGRNDRLKSHHNTYGGGTGELPIKDILTTHNKFTPVIQHKGPYVLHMLRYIVGNSTFDGIIQNYLALANGKNATITEFLNGVKQETTTDLAWFFEMWLNTTQSVDYSTTSLPSFMYQDGTEQKVEFTATKVGAAAMPGDLAIQYASGAPMTLMEKAISRTNNSITFTEVITEDVSFVVFDPNLWLLDVEKDNDKVAPIKDDLVVSAFTASPNTGLIEGDSVTFTATVKNLGDQPQGFVLTFYDNGTSFASKSVTTLAIGAQTVQQATWKSVKGVRNISVFVDSDEVLKEYNETNNRKNLTLEVAEFIAPPDLYFLGELLPSRTKVTEGEYVLLNATVYSNYKRTLSGIYVDFLVDGSSLTTITLGPVLSNSSTNVSANWQTTAGQHVIKAVLHAPPGVNESNTNNNELEGQVTINAIPEAKIEVDKYNPFSGEEIEFSGLSSTDDGSIVSYYFDFADGQTRNWSQSPKARHSYKVAGVYKATVTVRDNNGIESPVSDPVTVDVKNTLPTADFEIFPGEEGTVNTIFSFVPDANDPDGNITIYYWDFGDEKTTNEKQPTHKYTESGTFTVRLAVTDNNGQSSTPVTKTITIKNLKPNAIGSANQTEVFVNDPITLDATASWDPDGPKDSLVYKWTGNSKFLSTKVKDTNVEFSTPGEVTITLTVTDAKGAENKTSFDITVKAKPGGGDVGDEPAPNNTLLYAGAGAGVGIAVLGIVAFLFMRNKKAKEAAAAKDEPKVTPKAKGKPAKPDAKPTKAAPKPKEDAKAPAADEDEAPKKPEKKEPAEAPKAAPKPAAPPKPKAVKKPAPKPAAPAAKPSEKPVEKKPASAVEKAKKAAEDEWEG